jgi:hypothetical protein
LASDDILSAGIDSPGRGMKFRQNLKGAIDIFHIGGCSWVKPEPSVPILTQSNPSDDFLFVEVNLEIKQNRNLLLKALQIILPMKLKKG